MEIHNSQGISKITYNQITHNYCPIGRDWYTSNVRIEMAPGFLIPDYMELDKFIKDSINQKEMIIETVVEQIYLFIEEHFKPKWLRVTNTVVDAAHGEVAVTKEGVADEDY